jgi:hypothetical protein
MAPPTVPTAPNNNLRAPHCRSRFRHRRGMRMHGLATCDFCDSLITGTRHKCKDCPGKYFSHSLCQLNVKVVLICY